MYTQAEALQLLTEQRLLERAAAAIEHAGSSPVWRVVLVAIADRHNLLECALACTDPTIRASLDDLLPRELAAAPLPDLPPVLVPPSARVH